MIDNLAIICWSVTDRFPRWVSPERSERLAPRVRQIARDVYGD
jgi:hypothetical protein